MYLYIYSRQFDNSYHLTALRVAVQELSKTASAYILGTTLSDLGFNSVPTLSWKAGSCLLGDSLQ